MEANEIISSEDDYRKALAEIEQLIDSRPGTRNGERLDRLVTLVEAWEEKHHFAVNGKRAR